MRYSSYCFFEVKYYRKGVLRVFVIVKDYGVSFMLKVGKKKIVNVFFWEIFFCFLCYLN